MEELKNLVEELKAFSDPYYNIFDLIIKELDALKAEKGGK